MGWREELVDFACNVHQGRKAPAEIIDAVLVDLPTPDRIALARELLAETGRVVARDVPAFDTGGGGHGDGYRLRHKMGWNACRLAMMEGKDD